MMNGRNWLLWLVFIVVMGGAGVLYYRDEMAKNAPAVEGKSAVETRPGALRNVAAEKPLDEREHIAFEIRKLTADGNFAELESRAEEMRANDTRTREGWAELTSFYDGTNSGLLAIEELYGTENAEKQLDEWKEAYPESITQLVARAHFQVKQAWAARTGKAARDVRPEQWVVFTKKLEEVIATLTEMSNMPDKFDPSGHTLWFTVGAAAGLPREQMDEVFFTGVKEYPTSEAIFRGMAYYLLPQWQGKPGDLEKYGEDVLKAVPAPHNQIMYARIVGFVFSYHGADFFKKTRFPYEKVKTSLDALSKAYPEGLATKKLLCCMAATAGDKETARALFEEIQVWSDADVENYWTNKKMLADFQKWAKDTGTNPHEVTAFEKAVVAGDLDSVRTLAEQGADVNKVLSTGNTPLMAAIKNADEDVVEYLMVNGADLKGTARSGYSVAAQAVESENLEVLEKILAQAADMNAPVADGGWTLLHVAAQYDRAKAAELILAKPGVKLEGLTAKGSTPLTVAAVRNSAACAEVLIKHGADVNWAGEGKMTALHIAAYEGATEVIQVLLKAGADPMAKTSANVTALETAQRRHKKSAEEILSAAVKGDGK